MGLLLKFPPQLQNCKSRLCSLNYDTLLTPSLGIFITSNLKTNTVLSETFRDDFSQSICYYNTLHLLVAWRVEC